ncbi:MAG: hypothetical protein JXB15_02265 [Anaerolineales bacterium]|nr:hypothetical protein [Anaerolineales bacterium]
MKRYHRLALWVGFLLVFSLLATIIVVGKTPEAAFASPAAMPSSHLFQISMLADPEPLQRHLGGIAYNGADDEYMVVWHNNWNYLADIYARRISGEGALKAQFTVATGADGDERDRMDPDIAYNPYLGEYMVVYKIKAEDSETFRWDVWGRRVGADGFWRGAEFEIFSWPNRSFSQPRISYSPATRKYLVIASATDTVSYKSNDVAGRLINEDGTTPLAGHNISAQDQTLEPRGGDLAYNWWTSSFLVVWQQKFSETDWDIWGARVDDYTGNVIDPPGIFPLDVANADQGRPSIASDLDTRYLIVWAQKNSTPEPNWDVYGREYDLYGSPVGASFPIYNSSLHDSYPVVDMLNNQRTVAWESVWVVGSVTEEIMQFSWNPLDDIIFWLPSQVAENASEPQVKIGDDGNYLVVFSPSAISLYHGHIYGRLYRNDTIYLPLLKR